MPIIPFGPYRPDVSDYNGQHTKTATNVVPRGDGYGPFNAFASFTSALAGICRGMFLARKNDGSVAVFAATSTRLYLLNNTTGAWTDVSKGGAPYSTLSSTAQWQFVQFNNYVFATQANAPLQIFDLTTPVSFVDAAGSPPQAAYIAVVGRFLVLSGMATPNVYRIQWSGLNDVSSASAWTVGVNSSDFQDLADGGIVRGVVGGENGYVLQDSAIRRMTYAPGSPVVFVIERVSSDDGLYAPYSLISGGDRIFFCSQQGFKMITPGGYPLPIGKEKVDRTFFADVDTANMQLVIGAHDPQQSRIFWAYKSVNGASDLFDTILCYDWVLENWSKLRVSGEYISSLSRPGVTLEGVDAAFGSNIDTLTIPSLDNISVASLASLAGVDSTHSAGFFTGNNLEATLETPEQSGDGVRFFVRGIRAVSDAPAIYISVAHREGAQTAPTYSSETLIDVRGQAPQRVSTRFARARFRIPSGTSWTFASGGEPETESEGLR